MRSQTHSALLACTADTAPRLCTRSVRDECKCVYGICLHTHRPRAAGSPAGGPVAAALLAGVYPNARGEGIGRAHLYFALRQLAGHGDGKVVTAKQPAPSEPKLC